MAEAPGRAPPSVHAPRDPPLVCGGTRDSLLTNTAKVTGCTRPCAHDYVTVLQDVAPSWWSFHRPSWLEPGNQPWWRIAHGQELQAALGAEGGFRPTARRKRKATVLPLQELGSANNLSALRSGSFPSQIPDDTTAPATS